MLQWDKKKKERDERRSRYEKREITIEGKEKMEKAKQLIEGTYKWKGKYKKTQKALILNKEIKFIKKNIKEEK
jgi:hypothetical protein